MERSAMDCERAGNKYKQVEFLKDHIGEEFLGVVSGVSGFGFWVETVEHKCEGLVSVRDLSDIDDFRLDETDYALVGSRSGRRFRMGDIVTIKVISANLAKRQMDFEWVPKVNDEVKKIEALRSGIKPGKQLQLNKFSKGQSKPSDNFKKFHKKRKKK